MNVIYTFDTTTFNKIHFEESITHFNVKIKFISYSFNGQLKIIFDKILTENQEYELLNILTIP